jgi:8-oxo-dGTP pyrophosphatase MutT (NUDIX family)
LWADQLRAIANDGLRWSAEDPYDIHRFQGILSIAAQMFALQDTRGLEAIERTYHADLGHMAPYTGGDAAVFDEENRILLIQRADSGSWAMPGGAIEVGETPAEGASREAWEETGIEVEPTRLSGIYDSRYCGSRSSYHLYHFVFLCRPCDKDQQPRRSNETLDVAWYTEEALAALDIHPGHGRRIADAFGRERGEIGEAVFDPIVAGEE